VRREKYLLMPARWRIRAHVETHYPTAAMTVPRRNGQVNCKLTIVIGIDLLIHTDEAFSPGDINSVIRSTKHHLITSIGSLEVRKFLLGIEVIDDSPRVGFGHSRSVS
jgi:hypothetical protein